MKRIVVVLSLTVFVIGLPTAPVQGAAAPPAIGTRVVINAGAVLKVGDQVVDTGKAHRIYTVERANGDWLWLNSGAVSGWAQAADVVPLDRAVDLYSHEINRDANAAWAFFNRGLIRNDQQNFDQALSDYSEAIRIDPKYVPALINRGNVYVTKREFDKAVADYSQAIQINPKDRLAYLNRGIALQAKKDYDKAIADYDEAIRLGLQTAPVYNNRGHVWELKRDLNRAISDYNEAIRLDPRYSLAFFNRGNAWQSKGDFEKALADYAEKIRLDPTSPWGYAGRAWILATCPDAKYRDGKKAVELAIQACELGVAKDPYLDEIRAAAHAEAGEFDRAVEWQSRALQDASNIPGTDTQGDRLRLKLYQDKKPFRNERAKPSGT
jgi:tetratricopeptide (TPR) repeat protein